MDIRPYSKNAKKHPKKQILIKCNGKEITWLKTQEKTQTT